VGKSLNNVQMMARLFFVPVHIWNRGFASERSDALASGHRRTFLCCTTIRSAGVNRRVPLNGQLEPQPDFSGYLVVRKAELLKIRLVSPVLIG